MKHVVLSLLAAACGALSASALDASNARIWLDEKIQPDFASIGSGIASEKYGTTPAFARSWQYVSIPLHVEGVARGDSQPHYIPELKVRITLAVATEDAKGKSGSPELLTREITYVDIPLGKGKKGNMGESVVNVGVFVSPSGAFKLSEKDGSLAKKIIAVAVEGEFGGSSCNRVKEKPNDNVATAVVVNTKEGKNLAEGWWKKSGGSSSAALLAISETPFAHEYARLGFPATRPMYGTGAASAPAASTSSSTPAAASPSSSAAASDASSSSGPVAPAAAYDPRAIEHAAAAAGADGEASSSGDDAASGKKGKKSKKSRR